MANADDDSGDQELLDESRKWKTIMLPLADLVQIGRLGGPDLILETIVEILAREGIPVTVAPNGVLVGWGTLAYWDEDGMRYIMWTPVPSGGENNEIAELERMLDRS